MYFKPNQRLFNDEPGAAGGGELASTAVIDTPSTAPAPAEPSLDIAAASKQIGTDLFGKPTNAAARDDSGRFAGQPGAPSPSPAPPPPAPAASPAPTAGPAASPAPGQPPARDLTKAPNTWKADVAAAFVTLPESVRAEIHRREEGMFQGIEQYKADAGIGRAIKDVVQPILPDLRAANVEPVSFMQGMVNAHVRLSDQRAPIEQRAALAVDMLKQYGIDLSKFHLGDPPDNAPTLPGPTEQALRSEIMALQSRLNDRDSREAQTVYQDLSSKVTTFASDSANKHFNEVADDMVILLQGSGGKMSLKDAYDKACRANPTVYAKLQADVTAEAIRKDREEQEKRARAADKSRGTRVDSSGHSGSGTTLTGSMDDTLKQTLSKIKARN